MNFIIIIINKKFSGFDKIGKRFASICNGLGMKVLVNDIV
jgi:phosphoglycerate dehydrogenase-like enzyme